MTDPQRPNQSQLRVFLEDWAITSAGLLLFVALLIFAQYLPDW